MDNLAPFEHPYELNQDVISRILRESPACGVIAQSAKPQAVCLVTEVIYIFMDVPLFLFCFKPLDIKENLLIFNLTRLRSANLTAYPVCTDNFPYSQYGEQLKKPSIRACKNINAGIKNRLQKEIKKFTVDLERPFNDLTKEAFRDILKKYENKSK